MWRGRPRPPLLILRRKRRRTGEGACPHVGIAGEGACPHTSSCRFDKRVKRLRKFSLPPAANSRSRPGRHKKRSTPCLVSNAEPNAAPSAKRYLIAPAVIS